VVRCCFGPGLEAESFDALCGAFAGALLLRHFNSLLPPMVITHVLAAAMGGILLQPSMKDYTQQHWHPVAHHSRSFVDAEI
jgi:hypothetical protein